MNNKDKVEAFDKIYENDCYKTYEEECYVKIADKCLAVDQQEFGLINMSLDILDNKKGYDIDNYYTKDLYILPKEDFISNLECTIDKVKDLPLRVKMICLDDNYKTEDAPEALWIYYAALLLTANIDATSTHSGIIKSKRQYFKVYAYLACICAKVFCTFFFNNIYLFMERISHEQSLDKIKKYLEDEKELWKEYDNLFAQNAHKDVTRKTLTHFRRVLKNDDVVNHLIKIEEKRENGFLAFDYREENPSEKTKLVKVLKGIDLFQDFMTYFKKEMEIYKDNVSHMMEDISDIESYIQNVKGRLEYLVEGYEEDKGISGQNSLENILGQFHYYSNKEELLDSFGFFCDLAMIHLININ